MGSFIHVRSTKFPLLPGDMDEVLNEGMVGKALANHLVLKLSEWGYEAPFCCSEDWGWWVELAGFPFTFGVCIYGREYEKGQLDLYLTDGSPPAQRWSWRSFRMVSNAAVTLAATQLHADLVGILQPDPAIQVLATDLDAPFADDPPG